MKGLVNFIEERSIMNMVESYLSDEIAFALSCWVKTDKTIMVNYHVPVVFESLGQFDNCGKVVKMIVDYLKQCDNKDHQKEFDCKDLDVFFNTLKLNIKHDQYTYGEFEGLKSSIVSLTLHIEKDYDQNDVEFTIVHELIHAYEDHIRDGRGLPSITSFFKDKRYQYEYRKALRYMHIDKSYSDGYEETDEEYAKRLLAKCKYFLNDQEMFAYLGTVKTTVDKISKKVGPTFRSLKFDKVIELFRDTYIWQDYMDIYVFVMNLDNINKDVLSIIHYDLFDKRLSDDEIKTDIMKRWKKFQSLFLKYFSKAYAGIDFGNITLESFYQPPLKIFHDKYLIYG